MAEGFGGTSIELDNSSLNARFYYVAFSNVYSF